MSISIGQILNYLTCLNIEYNFLGNDQLTLAEYSSINNIKNNSITWIKDAENFRREKFYQVSNILVVSKEIDNVMFENSNVSFIFCNNPKEAYFSILKEFFAQEMYRAYISPTSTIETTAIGKEVYIGHNCFIGKTVKIADNVIIKNNVSIEGKVLIGRNSVIYSGVVIGSDGYGYFQNSEGINIKVPHYGGVIIGENVEIGANTCIDRGTLDDTRIGNNVKIDNLCHIAHNVIIEDNVSVIALSMIAGSVTLKKNSYIAPSASIRNQLVIGENSLVGIGAVVTKDVESNKVVAGVPAKIIKEL